MTCVPIKDGIICMSKIDFNCPYCGKEYSDEDEKYLNRCNRNKLGITRRTCPCGNRFGITYDMKGSMVSFRLKEAILVAEPTICKHTEDGNCKIGAVAACFRTFCMGDMEHCEQREI